MRISCGTYGVGSWLRLAAGRLERFEDSTRFLSSQGFGVCVFFLVGGIIISTLEVQCKNVPNFILNNLNIFVRRVHVVAGSFSVIPVSMALSCVFVVSAVAVVPRAKVASIGWPVRRSAWSTGPLPEQC